MVKEEPAANTPILRLRMFIQWAKRQGLCKSEPDFERQCGLVNKYVANNANGGKGNIGAEILGRITKAFPQLNLAWICNGEGAMIETSDATLNIDYKQAYEGAMMQIEALNRILKRKQQ